ncbi:Protein CLAVATA 3 [Striga hermonthica]|uniref:Protein CLAVATA 3 n=1 Tax=Striga hermonthica TaxID=68872 RepID=A0A9N7MSU1_STRHE|nr:Protein CLAVATA 3 [Striga hermonthica]
MAITKRFGLLYLLLVLSLFIQDFAGNDVFVLAESIDSGPSHRKLFLELKKMALRNRAQKLGKTEMTENWELRRVPTGPDPLHHNGQDPKKPRTP